MLQWQKKTEGFEWHKYVRTTIKVRREARRDRVDRLKQSAADGAKVAGEAAGSMARDGAWRIAHAARAAGHAAGRIAAAGLRKGAAGAHRLALGLMTHGSHGVLAAGRRARAWGAVTGAGLLRAVRSDALRPVLDLLGRPGISGPLVLVGAIALFAGLLRPALGFGLDREAGLAILLGVVFGALAYGPRVLTGAGPGIPDWLHRIPPGVRRRAAVACAVLLTGAIAWSFLPTRMELPSFGQASLSLVGGRSVEGRARPLTGDLLRIGSTIIKLSGIEVPEPQQRCQRPGHRRWRCAAASRAALNRLTRGRLVRCDVKDADGTGRVEGTCFTGKTDIAAALVKHGHAFAEQGFLASYGSEEAQAKAAKAGFWQGKAERPSAFRARTWEEAKRAAPDGCPIKGRAARGAKVYLLPWASDYGRVRVSAKRGDRWFCSEQEAISAGWRASGGQG